MRTRPRASEAAPPGTSASISPYSDAVAGAVNVCVLLSAQRELSAPHDRWRTAQAIHLTDTAALCQALDRGWWNNHTRLEKINVAKDTAVVHRFDAPSRPTLRFRASSGEDSMKALATITVCLTFIDIDMSGW